MGKSADLVAKAAQSLLRASKGRKVKGLTAAAKSRSLENQIVAAGAIRIFKRADVDGDGTLSKAEYNAALSFDAVNSDADSAVSMNEFVKSFTSSRYRRSATIDPAATSAEVAGKGTVEGSGDLATITARQYTLLAIKSGLPFVAFGFVDNFIMIMAGDVIDASLGVALALSTMAAAGLGNAVSDVVGIAAGDSIESLMLRIGLPSAGLTASQMMTKGPKRVHLAASMVGIVIGCILGLCPLLFIDQHAKELRAAFDKADKDGSNSLSSDEISMALHRFGLMMTAHEIEWLIRRVDFDHSGKMEFNEFKNLVNHWREYHAEYYKENGIVKLSK